MFGSSPHILTWATLTMMCVPAGAAGPVPAKTPASVSIQTETFMLDTSDPDLVIHVRNKRAVDQNRFDEDHVLVFVHGATYPSETGFDIALPGGSWMDHAAARGFDTYLVDVRGYGRSSRPPQMDQPPSSNPPFARTPEAITDLGTAIDFVRRRNGVQRVNLVGWSWGTAIAAGYTAGHNEKIRRLALVSPLWTFEPARPIHYNGAWRSVDRKTARQRSVAGIPAARVNDISPQAWFDQWWAANLATDPVGAASKPPVLRAPNGVLQDLAEFWSQGQPTWEPSEVRVPVMLIVGTWDRETPPAMARRIRDLLVNAPSRRLIELPEGTHAMVLEKHRMKAIRAIQDFLEK